MKSTKLGNSELLLLSSVTRKSVGLALVASSLFLVGCGSSDSSDFGGSDGAVEGAPVIDSVIMSSSSTTQELSLGDVVTVTISASESILAPTVYIGGVVADSISGSGTEWVATREIVLGDDEGDLAVNVVYADISGDEGASVTAVTEGSVFSFQNPDVYQLVWSDDFDGDALDTSNWNFQTGDGCPDLCGWGNNELQVYTEDQVSVANGILTITAEQTATGYDSARINTKDKMDFTYGRVEILAKLPEGSGTWPAMWMLPTDDVYGTWPQSGEIDILEVTNLGVGGKQTLQSTIHYGLPYPANSYNTGFYEPGLNPQDDFHTYAMELEEGEIRFYFDGIHYQTQTADNWFAVTEVGDAVSGKTSGSSVAASAEKIYQEVGGTAPFDQDFHLLLNLAIGGNLPGAPDGSAIFPQTFEIDSVKVFECVYPREGATCKTDVNAAVSPVLGAGSVNIFDLEIYTGVEPATLFEDGDDDDTNDLTNSLSVGSYNPNGEIMDNNFDAVDPEDATNSVWHWWVVGGIANTYIGSEDLTDHPTLDSGFDLRGSELAGELSFDMYVEQIADGTELLIKMDSLYPDLGQVTLTDVVEGQWKNYSVSIRDLLNNPFGEGSGLNLNSVFNLFIIETFSATPGTIEADVYIDNIRLDIICPDGDSCRPSNLTKTTAGTLVVFDDSLDSFWVDGVSAFDQAISFSSCVNDGGAGCPSISFGIATAEDTARAEVFEVIYTADAQFAGVILGQINAGTDLSEYDGGEVVFDLNIVANPNAAEFRMKVDCVGCPTDAGQREQSLGVPPSGWSTHRVSIADMINTAGGLDTDIVTTGLVIFPAFGSTAGVTYQLDNVRWEGADTDTAQPGAGSAGVYTDALDDQWVDGISAFDEAIGFGDCRNDDGVGCPSIAWQEVAADDTSRGQVLGVSYIDAAQFAGLIIGQIEDGLDFTSFASGTVNFDFNLIANPGNSDFIMKIDCTTCPSTGGGEREINIGMPVSGWQSFSVPVQDIINASGGPTASGLKIDTVTTGLVLFPAPGGTSGVSYQLDNVRWEMN